MVQGVRRVTSAWRSLVFGVLDRYPRLHTLIAITKELSSSVSFGYYALRGRPYFGVHMGGRQVRPERVPYMRALARKVVSERGSLCMAEIGSWAGESAVLWAEAAKRALPPDRAAGNGARAISIICIDPWRFYPSLETNPRILAMRRAVRSDAIFPLFLRNVRCSGNADAIIPIRADSQTAARLFRNELFDLIYIDGDHAYASVRGDIQSYAPLLKDGGYLCGDDLQLQATSVDQNYARRHCDEDVICDPRTRRYFHPGVTLAVGEFFGEVSCYTGFWVMQRSGSGWRQVRL